jgi:hypothetical protein
MISSHLERLLLHKALRGVDFSIRQVFLALHTADPGRDGSAEITGAGYGRQQITGFSPDGLANINEMEFRELPPLTVTHVGLWDAQRGGSFLWGEALDAPQTFGLGWSFRIRPRQIRGFSIR